MTRRTFLRLRFPLILAALVVSTVGVFASLPTSEREALIAIFQATGGPNWTYKHNWLGQPGTEGSWYGVTVKGNHVIKLLLPSWNGLSGRIPEEIGNLTYLEEFRIEWTQPFPSLCLWDRDACQASIASLPAEIGNLGILRVFTLAAKDLRTLPVEIGNLKRLEILHLSLPDIEDLTEEIGRLESLRELGFHGSTLTALPSGIGDLKNLRKLEISSNQLIELPESIGELQQLELLNASANHLGNLPAELGRLSNLRFLEVRDNRLTELPNSIGGLTSLETLDIQNNLLVVLPTGIGGLTSLRIFEASENRLESLPETLGQLTSLETLRLSRNSLTSLPTTLGHLKTLRTLDADHCLLTNLPSNTGELVALRTLNLTQNRLESIPVGFGRLGSLHSLDLSNNRLTGAIPAELGDLKSLEDLFLDHNEFVGDIPKSLGNLTALRNLCLSWNDLGGEIPSEVASIPRLYTMDLSHNRLTGPIPPQLGKRLELKTLDLSDNNLTGEVPEGLKNLRFGIIDLSRNRLSGSLPPGLRTNWGRFSGNQFTGEIPTEMIGFAALEADLRWNALRAASEEVLSYLEELHPDGDFQATQTVAPEGLRVLQVYGNSVTLGWTPILYTADPGGYEVFCSLEEGGPFTLAGRTAEKATSSWTVTGLEADTPYYFRVQTLTLPHENNRNEVRSEQSSSVSARTEPVARIGFPLMTNGPDQFTGLAAVNLDSEPAEIELRAFDRQGSLLTAERNPARLLLPSGNQFARLGWEIFALNPAASQEAWVEIGAGTSLLGNLLLFGAPNRLDGAPAFAYPEKRLIFTRPSFSFDGETASVWISLANPGDLPASLRLQLNRTGPEGTLQNQEAVTRVLPPNGMLRERIEDLLPAATTSPGYLEVLVTEGSGIIGLEQIELEKGPSLLVLSGQTPATTNRLFSAQTGTGSTLITELKLVNPGSEALTATLRWFGSDGTLLAEPMSVPIPAADVFLGNIANLFSTPLSAVGSLEVEATRPGMVGDIVFGQPDTHEWATAIPLQSEPFTEASFSQVANAAGLFTGLALFNPGCFAVEITIEVHSNLGSWTGQRSLTLGPKGRMSRLISEFVPETAGQVGGSVQIRSTGPIVAQQLFGDYQGRYLSVVPPTRHRKGGLGINPD